MKNVGSGNAQANNHTLATLFFPKEWYSSYKQNVECSKVFVAMFGNLVLTLMTIVIPRVTHLLALGDP